MFEQVALYVRATVIAEKATAHSADRTLVMRMMDSLGISVAGMNAARWRIEDTTARPQTTRTDDPDLAARKAKLRAIAGGVA